MLTPNLRKTAGFNFQFLFYHPINNMNLSLELIYLSIYLFIYLLVFMKIHKGRHNRVMP